MHLAQFGAFLSSLSAVIR